MPQLKTLMALPLSCALLLPAAALAANGARTLDCPAGTHLRALKQGSDDQVSCVKAGPGQTGEQKAHGPYRDFYANGQLRSEGQFVDGNRSGTWTYYDEQGRRTGTTEFARGDYHGRRVEFFANGKPKAEEHYVKGMKDGTFTTFNEQGEKVQTAQYKADRVVGEQAQSK